MACPSEIALMCRLCLLKDKQQVNIPIFEDHSDSKLLVKISALLPIKIFKEDQLPKNICDGCSDKLNLLYEFWNVSLESERTLLSWLKNDNLTISALAEPIEETIVKEEVEVEDESPYLDLAQHSSMDEFQEAEEEDVEEPPSKRPRRLAAMKAGISIATVSDDDNYEDGPQTEDVVKLEFESDENDNSEDIAKLENESDNDISSSVPENSTHESHDQPGPSGLGKSGTETPVMAYKRPKVGLRKIPENTMKAAIRLVLAGGYSVKKAAEKCNIPRTTLRRYLTKCEGRNIDLGSEILEGAPRLTPNYEVNKIFTEEEENMLCDYLKQMANLHHGLNPKQIKSFAHDFAEHCNKKMPQAWVDHQSAGKHWFTGFMKRNPSICLRSAKDTS